VSAVDPTVEVYFDDVTATDISNYTHAVSITRGRTRELDEVSTGTCSIELRNHTGRFVPYDVVVDGSEILEEDGLVLTDESENPLYDESSTVFASGILPGKRVVVSVEGVSIFDGFIDDWNYSYTPDNRADATIEAVDALSILAGARLSEWETAEGEGAGYRIVATLNHPDVAYDGSVVIDTGLARLQGDTVSAGTSALTYLQLVARTDFGSVFVDRSGVFRFRDRRSAASAAVSAAFADDGSEIPFSGINPQFGSELFYGRVTVQRAGGAVMSAVSASSNIRTLPLTGLLFDTDLNSQNLADFLLDLYEDPQTRIDGLTVILEALTEGQRETVLELDLGDVITILWTPQGTSSSTTQTVVIEGIDHATSVDGVHAVQFRLSQRAQSDVFTLDSATLGVLDVNRLAY
jgi:hypothetical protein